VALDLALAHRPALSGVSAGDNKVVVVTYDNYPPRRRAGALTDDSSGAAGRAKLHYGGGTFSGLPSTLPRVYLQNDRLVWRRYLLPGGQQSMMTLNGNTVVTLVDGCIYESIRHLSVVRARRWCSSGSGSGSASVEYRVDVTYDNYQRNSRWFHKQVSTGAFL
jgi:hypothetical protein